MNDPDVYTPGKPLPLYDKNGNPKFYKSYWFIQTDEKPNIETLSKINYMNIEIKISPECSEDLRTTLEKLKFKFTFPIVNEKKWYNFLKKDKKEKITVEISDKFKETFLEENTNGRQVWFPDINNEEN